MAGCGLTSLALQIYIATEQITVKGFTCSTLGLLSRFLQTLDITAGVTEKV